MSLEMTAAQAAYLDQPGRGGTIRRIPHEAAEKEVRGYLVQHSETTERDGQTQRITVKKHTHRMEILRRPPETARLVTEIWSEKEDQWVAQAVLVGGAVFCCACGEPFGKSQRLGENLYKNLEAVAYHVIGEDTDGDPVDEEVFCCYNAAECAERFKQRAKKGEIVDVVVEPAQVDLETAYLAARQALGEDAPLPEGMKRCAYSRCQKVFTPFTPTTQCCTANHVSLWKREQQKDDSDLTKARRAAQREGVKAAYENRARAAAQAEAEDAENEYDDN